MKVFMQTHSASVGICKDFAVSGGLFKKGLTLPSGSNPIATALDKIAENT